MTDAPLDGWWFRSFSNGRWGRLFMDPSDCRYAERPPIIYRAHRVRLKRGPRPRRPPIVFTLTAPDGSALTVSLP